MPSMRCILSYIHQTGSAPILKVLRRRCQQSAVGKTRQPSFQKLFTAGGITCALIFLQEPGSLLYRTGPDLVRTNMILFFGRCTHFACAKPMFAGIAVLVLFEGASGRPQSLLSSIQSRAASSINFHRCRLVQSGLIFT